MSFKAVERVFKEVHEKPKITLWKKRSKWKVEYKQSI